MPTKRTPYPTVNLSVLCSEVAHRTGLHKNLIENVVRVIFDVIKQRLYDKCEVKIPGFGLFHLWRRKGMKSYLPYVSKLYIQPRLIPKFRFYSTFKSNLAKVRVDDEETAKTIDDLDYTEE